MQEDDSGRIYPPRCSLRQTEASGSLVLLVSCEQTPNVAPLDWLRRLPCQTHISAHTRNSHVAAAHTNLVPGTLHPTHALSQ